MIDHPELGMCMLVPVGKEICNDPIIDLGLLEEGLHLVFQIEPN